MVDTWGSKLNEFMQIVINKQFTKPIGRAWLIRERIVNEVPLRTIPDVIWYFSDNSIKDYIEFSYTSESNEIFKLRKAVAEIIDILTHKDNQ